MFNRLKEKSTHFREAQKNMSMKTIVIITLLISFLSFFIEGKSNKTNKKYAVSMAIFLLGIIFLGILLFSKIPCDLFYYYMGLAGMFMALLVLGFMASIFREIGENMKR